MNDIVLADPYAAPASPGEYPEQRLLCNVEFFSALSHELRTPLSVIKGFTQGLIAHWDHLPAAKQYEYVERIMRSTVRMERLVSDLSLAARLVEGVSLQSSSIEVAAAVAQAVEEIRVLHRDRVFTLVAPRDTLYIWADPQRILQVLTNLLDNAAKYSPGEGPVIVRWLADQPLVRIEVCDAGAGLSLDEQALLFRRFGQSPRMHQGRGAAHGSGLGLFICKGLVEAMGGTIGVQTAPGAGNTFWFTLPQPAA
jgi:signal transduction histidine kinase